MEHPQSNCLSSGATNWRPLILFVDKISNKRGFGVLGRDRLLATTDWRASSDLTLADAWKTYRQSLRDLPASASPKLDASGNLDMSSVTFPTEPS